MSIRSWKRDERNEIEGVPRSAKTIQIPVCVEREACDLPKSGVELTRQDLGLELLAGCTPRCPDIDNKHAVLRFGLEPTCADERECVAVRGGLKQLNATSGR